MTMKLIIRITFCISILCFCSLVRGQQDGIFSQYVFNPMTINPAYIGTQEALSMAVHYRNQWTKLEDAPSMRTFTAHMPISNESFGVGIMASQDRIGVTTKTNGLIGASYRVPVGKKKYISFGLQGGVSSFRVFYSYLDIKDPDDPDFRSGDINELVPTLGAGLYFYSEKTFAGASIPQVNQSEFGSGGELVQHIQDRHLYVFFGHVFNAGMNLKIKPMLLLKGIEGAPLQADFNLNFLFVDRLWLGFTYKTFTSVDFMAQFLATRQLKIGYNYEFIIDEFRNTASSTHEIMLGYLLNFNDRNMLNPRDF